MSLINTCYLTEYQQSSWEIDFTKCPWGYKRQSNQWAALGCNNFVSVEGHIYLIS